MKIAICNVQEFNPTIGGIERVSVTLAKSLKEAGIDVVFVACRKSTYSKRYRLPAKQLFLPQSSDYCEENVRALVDIIKKENIDVLLNQNSHSKLYNKTCFEVKQLSGVKLISALHFSPDMRIKGNRNLVNFRYLPLKENILNILRDICTRFPFIYITMYEQTKMLRNLYLNSDKVVLLSNEYRKSYLHLSGVKEDSKLTVINNMLSFPYESQIYPKKKQIIYCGRLLFSPKRPDRILYIWKKLQDKLPDWNIVIVGDGPFYDKMLELSIKLSLRRIEFVGFKNPVEYYKESSIFCMTSNHEGWGLVLTEAMQFGCVPVAFKSFESITDIIKDNKNGILVRPFDLDGFSDKLYKLIKYNDFDSISKNAIKSMFNFSPKTIIPQWINLVQKVIKK